MTRRDDGRWVETITVKVDGRSKRKYFYGATKREVLLKVAAFHEEQDNGKYWRDVCDEWWEEYRPTLAVNTLRGTTPAYKRARECFPDKRIREITPSMVVQALDKLIHAQHMAHKTAATQLGAFRLAFRYAVLHDYITDSPAREVQVPNGLDQRRRELPAVQDVRTIIRTQGRGGMGELFAFTAVYTGLRKGELLGLTWDDIDLDEGLIYVRRSIYSTGGKGYAKEPKTQAGIRITPIVDDLLEALKAAKKSRGHKLFTYDGEWMSEGQFERMWRELCREYELTCTAHQLRHELATLLLENGVPVETARVILGHADTNTTERVYQHIREAHLKDKLKEIRHLKI